MLPLAPIGNSTKSLFVPPDNEMLKPQVNSISLTQELSGFFDMNMNIPIVDSAFCAFMNDQAFNDSIQKQINEARMMEPLSLGRRISQKSEMLEEVRERDKRGSAPREKSSKLNEPSPLNRELSQNEGGLTEVRNKMTRFIDSLPQDEELVEKQDGMVETLSKNMMDQFKPVQSRLVLQHPTKRNLKVKAVYPIVPSTVYAGQEYLLLHNNHLSNCFLFLKRAE